MKIFHVLLILLFTSCLFDEEKIESVYISKVNEWKYFENELGIVDSSYKTTTVEILVFTDWNVGVGNAELILKEDSVYFNQKNNRIVASREYVTENFDIELKFENSFLIHNEIEFERIDAFQKSELTQLDNIFFNQD